MWQADVSKRKMVLKEQFKVCFVFVLVFKENIRSNLLHQGEGFFLIKLQTHVQNL